MTARLAGLEPHFTPGEDALVYGVDLYYGEVDRLRKLVYDGGDQNKAYVIKLSEGQAPETKRDDRLAARTYAGAVEAIELAIQAHAPWTVYHYATPGRNSGTYLDDAANEARWFLAQLEELESEVCNLHDDQRIRRMLESLASVPPSADAYTALTNAIKRNTSHRLRVWLDVEDKHTPLGRQGLEQWCEEWMSLVEAELGYAPGLYTYTSYAKKMLPRQHCLGRYPLVQAHYHNNRPDRLLSPPPIPSGWKERAGWQFTSRYRGGLDRNVFRLSALAVPDRGCV